jgi:hypothetical protein
MWFVLAAATERAATTTDSEDPNDGQTCEIVFVED